MHPKAGLSSISISSSRNAASALQLYQPQRKKKTALHQQEAHARANLFSEKTLAAAIILKYIFSMICADVYKECPVFKSGSYLLRAVKDEDASQLLLVYSDKKAVPFFNSDNCHGDNFYYTTMERMKQAIDFWKQSYQNGWFVRWTVVDKAAERAIGTIEIFRREADDYFTDCALLRLDVRSDYEKTETIQQILKPVLHPAPQLFGCSKIATKAVPFATERIAALKELGFSASPEKLIGHDGTLYGDYFVLFP